jgi:hypothetical protein
MSGWRPALLVGVSASTTWAVAALLGSSATWSALAGALGAAIGLLLTNLDGATKEERHTVAAALREHRDPGPQYREAVTREAHVLLAARPVDRWLPPVLLVGLVGACVVTAIVRSDVLTALPAIPLAILGTSVLLLRRRSEAMADRWLADPPTAADEPT